MGNGVLCEDAGRMTHARLSCFLSMVRTDEVRAWLVLQG
jgi:hypothetical protein